MLVYGFTCGLTRLVPGLRVYSFAGRWLFCVFTLMGEQGINVVFFSGFIYSAREPQRSHMLAPDTGPALFPQKQCKSMFSSSLTRGNRTFSSSVVQKGKLGLCSCKVLFYRCFALQQYCSFCIYITCWWFIICLSSCTSTGSNLADGLLVMYFNITP